MRKSYSNILLLIALLFCFSANAVGQTTATSLKVSGEVTRPLVLSPAQVAAMPHINVTMNDRDGKPHMYSGVSIQAILDSAGVTTGKQLRGENLSKYMLVKCADGYEVLFSLAELDADFTDRKAIIADAAEGAPLPAGKGPFRMVLEGEKKPARDCFQVTDIIIKFAKD
jgi:DMSO/TMAO reductase YedYZ molybdopterin-dependent catalytic subunit